MLMLADLTISQNEVRHGTAHLNEMVRFVKKGGFFTKFAIAEWTALHGGRPNPPLIGITRFPDNKLLIHDGHNRAISVFLGGRYWLSEGEYFIKDYTYEEYTLLEPENGWFTPFDPRTQLRKADFGEYKTQARYIYENHPAGLPEFVRDYATDYCCNRDISTVAELAKRVAERM